MSLLEANKYKPLEGGPSFSLGNRVFRAVWNSAWLLLASWTPPPLHRWRVWLLCRFGAKLHPTVRVYGSARVWYPPNLVMHADAVLGPKANCYCMSQITLCEKVVISQGAQLCGGTHDICDPDFQLVTKPIVIKAGAWVAAEAFVGPGVTVGEGAVIGARAVIFKDAQPWSVYTGNPATVMRIREMRSDH